MTIAPGRVLRRRGGFVLLLLAVCATAYDALAPGDPAFAEGEWRTARAVKREDWADPLYVWVAEVQQAVAPWQPGAAEARARLHAIAEGRRAALPHDRGGRRVPLAAEAAPEERAGGL